VAEEAGMPAYVIWFDELRISDGAKVGGKNAALGELMSGLRDCGIRVPAGFATTTEAYRAYLQHNGLEPHVESWMQKLQSGNATVEQAGEAIRTSLLGGEFPSDVAVTILTAYECLAEQMRETDPAVAVRSSATAEDLPTASFAGQQESFLNVRGAKDLLAACKRCFASLYTDRAISYRQAKNIDQVAISLSTGVQQMVRGDLGGAGVCFSLDTESGFPRAAVISANWGLGETIVQGTVEPDKYSVFKPLLESSAAIPIIEKRRGAKERKLIYGEEGRATKLIDTNEAERNSFVLTDQEILTIARWTTAIERHFGTPMDVEWAKDGQQGELFVVQARPETVHSAEKVSLLRTFRLQSDEKPILTGSAVGESIACGPVRTVRTTADLEGFPKGAVLVARSTDPDWVPAMRRASAIVTDEGGPTSHAAIVSRELGVPAVVGTQTAMECLVDGTPVTVSCAEGERGKVFAGTLPFTIEEVEVGSLPTIDTDLMVNSADPGQALRWWRLPAKGVGLARMEFIINTMIKAHPMAIAHPERVDDPQQKSALETLAKGYPDAKSFFVEVLAMGIAKLAAPFHPHPAIVRLSDFKTNEYAHLIGGSVFEQTEENPMLGFRGASRYYDDRYKDGFALECQAVKRARDILGFTNIIVMIPFCRTPAEADRVLEQMALNGLNRGENGLQVYMMCEIPSNVLRAREFARRFDGFSIGSNDLTQLVLGIDRDSGNLAGLFDERDPAVTTMISQAIKDAHACGIKIGICGQAPSNYPDFAKLIVREGIDSISLNPDSFVATLRHIATMATKAPQERSEPLVVMQEG
jgi:pyruvate,water dikinase